jgi:hypothetical protein
MNLIHSSDNWRCAWVRMSSQEWNIPWDCWEAIWESWQETEPTSRKWIKAEMTKHPLSQVLSAQDRLGSSAQPLRCPAQLFLLHCLLGPGSLSKLSHVWPHFGAFNVRTEFTFPSLCHKSCCLWDLVIPNVCIMAVPSLEIQTLRPCPRLAEMESAF